MFIPDWTWLLFAYLAGSFSTWFLFWGSLRHQTIEDTIDRLCKDGFLRYRRSLSGEITIQKYNEE